MTESIYVLPTKRESDTANVRKVKALYSALKAKDFAALRDLLVDEPIWDVTPGFPEGGIYKGMSAVFGEFYMKLLAQVHSLGAFPEAFVDGGDVVVAIGCYRIRAHESGAPEQVRFAHIWGIDAERRIKGVWQVADSARFPRA